MDLLPVVRMPNPLDWQAEARFYHWPHESGSESQVTVSSLFTEHNYRFDWQVALNDYCGPILEDQNSVN